MRLLLTWITLPLLLFSLAQTKLGWYISMVYPAIVLLLALALTKVLTERLALSLVTAVMFMCCLRLPVPADGSPDVKQFALQAAQFLNPGEPIYVSEQVCMPHTPPLTAGMPPIPVGYIRPAMRFYIDRPLRCIEAHEVDTGQYPRHSYLISEQVAWARTSQHGRVVFESQGFVLARWD